MIQADAPRPELVEEEAAVRVIANLRDKVGGGGRGGERSDGSLIGSLAPREQREVVGSDGLSRCGHAIQLQDDVCVRGSHDDEVHGLNGQRRHREGTTKQFLMKYGFACKEGSGETGGN